MYVFISFFRLCSLKFVKTTPVVFTGLTKPMLRFLICANFVVVNCPQFLMHVLSVIFIPPYGKPIIILYIVYLHQWRSQGWRALERKWLKAHPPPTNIEHHPILHFTTV